MTWEGLLDALAAAAHAPEELDYMENYGAVAVSRHEALHGRHPRCIFGTLKIDRDLVFDVYVFLSPDEAREFAELMGTATIRHQNLAAQARPADLPRLKSVFEGL